MSTGAGLVRLWIHETRRVFQDRLISVIDTAQLDQMTMVRDRRNVVDGWLQLHQLSQLPQQPRGLALTGAVHVHVAVGALVR